MERSTRQRIAIRAVINAAGRPLTPQEILDEVRASGAEAGIATVYRNLKHLLAEGAIQAVNLPGDNPRYEAAQAALHHHHHFHCLRCDRAFDIPGCVGRIDQLAPAGFLTERHELTLYGRCPQCAGAVA